MEKTHISDILIICCPKPSHFCLRRLERLRFGTKIDIVQTRKVFGKKHSCKIPIIILTNSTYFCPKTVGESRIWDLKSTMSHLGSARLYRLSVSGSFLLYQGSFTEYDTTIFYCIQIFEPDIFWKILYPNF